MTVAVAAPMNSTPLKIDDHVGVVQRDPTGHGLGQLGEGCDVVLAAQRHDSAVGLALDNVLGSGRMPLTTANPSRATVFLLESIEPIALPGSRASLPSQPNGWPDT